jgi:hypothetical protein
MGSELKLYRSVKDILWFSFDPETGWVMFPAEVGGWHKRQASSGVDPTDMCEVPLRMGFNTGIPGAPMSSGLFQVPERKTSLRPLPVVRCHRTRKAIFGNASRAAKRIVVDETHAAQAQAITA